jgi:hypothetical protein
MRAYDPNRTARLALHMAMCLSLAPLVHADDAPAPADAKPTFAQRAKAAAEALKHGATMVGAAVKEGAVKVADATKGAAREVAGATHAAGTEHGTAAPAAEVTKTKAAASDDAGIDAAGLSGSRVEASGKKKKDSSKQQQSDEPTL